MFFKISNNIFTLKLLLIVSHKMFVICDNGPLCLPFSNVILFENKDRTKLAKYETYHVMINSRKLLQKNVNVVKIKIFIILYQIFKNN